MAACYPLGRIGTELRQLPFYALDMLVKHSPDGDPWLRGESLEVIIKRMTKLSGRDYSDVNREVTRILKEKHEKTVKKFEHDNQAMLWQECGGFGATMICEYLENSY